MAFRSLRDRFRRGGSAPLSIVPDSAEEKKASIVRASVFFIAVTCLLVGILYQMGVLHFAMPSLEARKIQHRGAFMPREGVSTVDDGARFTTVAGNRVYRAEVRPADAQRPLPAAIGAQRGTESPQSLIDRSAAASSGE
jgi:hypothetical protein